MLLLIGTTDKLRVASGSAATLDIVASYMDRDDSASPATMTPGATPTAMTTATTVDVVAAPGSASKTRNVRTLQIRNKHATVATDVTVIFDRSGTGYELHKATLAPGEQLSYAEGYGFFKVGAASPAPVGTNFSTTATAAGFAADTYLANTAIPLAGLGTPTRGRRYIYRLMISKTAAGTATPILTVRVGTVGSTADAARLTFTWGAGTAAIDRGEIELECIFESVGAGTSAVLAGKANWTTNLQTTGLTSTIKALKVTSAGFDSTAANQIIGLSYNGGTAAVHTVEWQAAATDQL